MPDSATTPPASRRHRLLLGSIAVLLAVIALLTWQITQQRSLSPLEQACVGRWSFPPDDDAKHVRKVYDLRADGQVREEHYYLSSATSNVPRLIMYGRWRVEPDRTLVVERAGGMSGLASEVTRRMRTLLGERQFEFPLLRRFYKVQQTGTDGLVVTASSQDGPKTLTLLPSPHP